MIHVDWLTVSQRHEQAPDWGATRRIDLDVETGNIEIERVLSDSVQASWDTSLRVRCFAGRVEVSGNPSKWSRLDAVTGLTHVWDCIEVYNDVLRQLGLPEFQRGWYSRNDEGETYYHGAEIARVDLTRNLVVGETGVKPFLDWIAAQTWGTRLQFRPISENTVGAGKRNRRQRVFYDKAKEILANIGSWKRSRSYKRESAIEYLHALAEWANSIGLVRDEIRLGTKFFCGHELRLAENWGPQTVEQLFKEQSEIQTLEAGAMIDYKTGIYEVLRTKGYSETIAGRLQKIVHSWIHGDEWKLGLKKTAQYKYASILRKECGLDIRRPSNVRSLALCIKPKVLEARPLTPEDLPEWYDKPTLRQAA